MTYPESFRPLHTIAEVLAVEFCALPVATVVRVLTECADELPEADSLLVESAARARLAASARHPG
jgi:Ni2+-binding GTPase involved in maturation of urease and hydrogenase